MKSNRFLDWVEAHPKLELVLSTLLFPIAYVSVRLNQTRLTKSGRAARRFRKAWLESLTPEERKEMKL